jgi:hypothetical protein
MNDFLQYISSKMWVSKLKSKIYLFVRLLWRPPILWAYPRIPPSL